MLCKHPEYPPHGSRSSSESVSIESDQDNDKEDFDDSRTTELEEWNGFQDTVLDGAVHNAELKPESRLDSRPTRVKPSMGTSRYIPPHLREEPSDPSKTENDAKLTRQLKGFLNKLSEQNIATILSNIEALYREHRRHGELNHSTHFELDVTSAITSFVIESISAHSTLLDSYVILHATLVSSLYRIIGVEFAAHFLQNAVSSYTAQYSTLNSATADDATGETPGKECSNLIILLSELYNFQVISCVLIYDIIRDLLSAELTELVVELLLKLLRNSGQQLRHDDPSALKDIVQIVQNKALDVEKPANSRTRFMLETLANLKNNKIKRAAMYQAGGDTVERLKKFLAGLGKIRHLMPHEPLRIGLDDLLSTETRGKWWLVGAAWTGDPLVERQESLKRKSTTQDDDTVENALLKLAKKQGMNTDIRRSIFVVLMSSDDYVDACERLAQLNLTEVQQREVVRVLVSCCGNEKSYNPYYAFVCQHLCQTSHSYKITLQYCLWDFLRDLGEASVGGAEVLKHLKGNDDDLNSKIISATKMHNVANAYAWWVAKDCVTLSVFKPVDFTVLKPRTREFLSNFFRKLFVNSQVSAPVLGNDMPATRNKSSLEAVFIKATRIQVLAMGLVYFLTEMKKRSEEEFIQWASSVAIDTLRTGLDIIPTL
ncbi:armadillo-type protein [Lactifluus volemus]|nr:armadillo-type protein [Lactifluus volemus]